MRSEPRHRRRQTSNSRLAARNRSAANPFVFAFIGRSPLPGKNRPPVYPNPRPDFTRACRKARRSPSSSHRACVFTWPRLPKTPTRSGIAVGKPRCRRSRTTCLSGDTITSTSSRHRQNRDAARGREYTSKRIQVKKNLLLQRSVAVLPAFRSSMGLIRPQMPTSVRVQRGLSISDTRCKLGGNNSSSGAY